jgi:hypothetical protein
LIVVARVCFVLVAMPFISCLECDWFGGDSTSIFDSYVMCWTPKRPRIAPPFTHTTLYIYMQRLVALRLMKYGRKASRQKRPKNGVETRCVCFCGSEFVAWYFWNSGANLVSYVKEVALSRCSVGFVWFWAQCS